VLNIPNLITILRVLLIPVIVYFLIERSYGAALITFLVSALSDLLDGFIARRFNQMSAFGAILDPIADKLTMLAVTMVLAAENLLPVWLAVAIVARDVVIVSGAVAYRALTGHLEMVPTLLSKLNTLLEFGLVMLVLVDASALANLSAPLRSLFILVFVTVSVSGLHYVWVWSWKAARETRRTK